MFKITLNFIHIKVTVSCETRAHVTNFLPKGQWPRRVNVDLQGSRGTGSKCEMPLGFIFGS